jgi:pyridoxal phosphate enzyme (YggS family)
MNGIVDRVYAVRERIAAAARRAGRPVEEITLVAVTKTQPARLIAQALAAGVHDLGENRVQEAIEKIDLLAAERARIRWHLIGHLQRNKARQAAAGFDCIHSVDSLRLAEALDRHVDGLSLVGQRRLPVLLQVNVSGEASKEGFDLPGGVANSAAMPAFLAQVERIVALPRLQVQGLMTIAPLGVDPQQARPTFHSLRLLRDELARRFPAAGWEQLSMGMTDDFEVAIEEGATLVRVGRAIFGERY